MIRLSSHILIFFIPQSSCAKHITSSFFVRDLEQGKKTLRLDKVNQLLDLFNYEMKPTLKSRPYGSGLPTHGGE